MKVIKATSKKSLLEEITNIDDDCQEVYINLRPTKEILQNVMDRCSSLQTLYCPQSLLKQTAKNALFHAGENNIKIVAGDFEVGRPKKYPEKTINEIVSQRQIGKGARQISDDLGVPLRTVYFYLKQNK